MAANVLERADLVAQSLEQVPDEAYLGFAMASTFTSLALFLTGRKDEALFVGLLGTAFASITMMVKILATQRSTQLRP